MAANAESLVVALQKFFQSAACPILFSGAGVSARAGLSSWKSLVEGLAEQLRQTDPLSTSMMLECAREGNYTLAVDYFFLSSKMPDSEKYKLLRKSLSTFSHESLECIARLPVKGHITTNFDRSLLTALGAYRTTAVDFRYGDPSFRQAQWETDLFVARIHGAIEFPSSVVLSTTQFKELSQSTEYYDFLSDMFLNKNVLFIGFSFYDPAIKHILESINSRCGSAVGGRHTAFIPEDANADFFHKANRLNIEIVRYDPADKHSALWTALERFSTAKPPVPEAKSVPWLKTKRYLAACLARTRTQDGALREVVVEGVLSAVLQERAPCATSRPELIKRVEQTFGLSRRECTTLVDEGLRRLKASRLCRQLKSKEGESGYAWNGEAKDEESLNASLERLVGFTVHRANVTEQWRLTEQTRQHVRTLFEHLVLKRGWDLGAAFAGRRPPDDIDPLALIDECGIPLAAYDRERLNRVILDLLRRPTEEEAKTLGELGSVSFALEMAFHSPRNTLTLTAILPSEIYLDASILLPAIVEGHPLRQLYGATFARLRDASNSSSHPFRLIVAEPYLNEVISHRQLALSIRGEAGPDFDRIAISDALFHGSSNTNVFIGAYANLKKRCQVQDFDDFLQKFAPYSTEASLAKWLRACGFEVHSLVKENRFADYYARLEVLSAKGLTKGKTPLLIQHDAIQIAKIEAECRKNNKVLFVTADRLLHAIASQPDSDIPADAIITNTSLIQLVDLLIGKSPGNSPERIMLLWSARVSTRSEALRSYFVAKGLEHYDAAMAMTIPKIVERFTEEIDKELTRKNADLDSHNATRRAAAFAELGRLENGFFEGMSKEVAKLNARLE